MNPRGGKREGAGRKGLPGGRMTAAFVLSHEQFAWVEAEAKRLGISKSEVIRRLIDRNR